MFIDWNCQLHKLKLGGRRTLDEGDLAEKVMNYIGKRVAKVLSGADPRLRFDVELRGYHGWHKGYEPTDRRKALQTLVSGSIGDYSTHPRVSLRSFGFGDKLSLALETRLNPAVNGHLPGTLRDQEQDGNPVEKMVDTALAADLVSTASQEPDAWFIILGDDIDLAPPIFAAEALVARGTGRVLFARSVKKKELLKLDGLVVQES